MDTSISADIPRITHALEVIYDPRSSNELRVEATVFLESAKKSPDALSHGFHLAAFDPTSSHMVRYFGLSMVIFNLKHVYNGKNETLLRDYALQLAQVLRDQDPQFLRNKVAQVWVEVAKRIWGPTCWQDMDEQLVKLWETNQTLYTDFVLAVLEAISEDVFNQDDYIAALRSDLGSAFARICIPQDILDQHISHPDDLSCLRAGGQGWLLRISIYLRFTLQNDASEKLSPSQRHTQALKALTALQSFCLWMPPVALSTANCTEAIGCALVAGDTPLRIAATEALCCIFARFSHTSPDIKDLLKPMYSPQSLDLLRDAFRWSGTALPDRDEQDEQKYNFAKKLSELLTCLGTWAERWSDLIVDVTQFYQLILEASKHPSVLISMPLLQHWTKFLKKPTTTIEVVQTYVGPLLELASARCKRYDMLPEDSSDPTMVFLAFDCDNTNQREMVLSQYRQSCLTIVEHIVRIAPVDALGYVLREAVSYFQSVVNQSSQFDPMAYSKNSDTAMLIDAHLATVDASVRGSLRYAPSHANPPAPASDSVETNPNDGQYQLICQLLAEYCRSTFAIQTKDPDFKKRLVAQAVSITSKISPNTDPIALSMLDSILSIRSDKTITQGSPHYTEMSKELLETSAYAAQRLAIVFADQFLPIYDELRSRIEAIIADEGDELQPSYYAFLVMIIHRASNLDTDTRTTRLRQMINPVQAAWTSNDLARASSSYESLCALTGWDQLPGFLAKHGFGTASSWADQQLNDEGRQFQADLLKRNELIPIKLTRAILKATTDKVDESSPVLQISKVLWKEIMPAILPGLINILEYATLFHDSSSWGSLPEETKHPMIRLLQDRFWQSGISNESKDAFVSRVSASKFSYEGFGSTVRRTIRQIRAGCCDILLFFTKLGDSFFEFPNLPTILGRSLYGSSLALTAHHFSLLVTFSSQIIQACPKSLHPSFLPPLLAPLFVQLHHKLASEWDAVNRRSEQASMDDDLDDEMKNQSILRSMTYNACYLFYNLVRIPHANGKFTGRSSHDRHGLSRVLSAQVAQPNAHGQPTEHESDETTTFHKVLFGDSNVLEAFLVFAATAIRVRDSHSVAVLLNGLRDAIPHVTKYAPPDKQQSARQYLCSEVLKAVITSLHEPYFVESQRDLAYLITQLIHVDPQECIKVLASLPGLSQHPERVAAAVGKICESDAGSRPGRGYLMELLEHIRGVSIHEMGKIAPFGGGSKKKRDRGLVAAEKAKLRNTDTEDFEGLTQLLNGV